jgi:hypothetical protein
LLETEGERGSDAIGTSTASEAEGILLAAAPP